MKADIKKYPFPLWYTAAYVVFGIILNVAGRIFAAEFKLPFWFDTIGTGVSAYMLGSVFGGFTGLATNLIIGIGNPISIAYAIINAVIGVVIGVFSRKGGMNDLFGAMCGGLMTGFIAAIGSTPISCFFSDGKSTNIWGAALFDMLGKYQLGTGFKCFVSQLFIDIPDKIVTFVMLYGLIALLKKMKLVYSEK